MSEPEVNALCLIAAGLGLLICVGVARLLRLQDEKNAARRAIIERHVRELLRRLM